MTAIDLADVARLAKGAIEGGDEVALAVVVGSASRPELIGRRLVWHDSGMEGELADPESTEAAKTLLGDPKTSDGCHTIAGLDIELYVERVAPPNSLVIVGAGHIAQPLSRIGSLLGFQVTVVDDRPEFARGGRFPDANQVIVVDFSAPFENTPITPGTYIVLVTRGHRFDYDCMRALAAQSARPAYLGMIGSQRRVRATFEQLAREGVDAVWMEQVYAPIGLDIGSQTPAEIAVAIAAEMVLHARGGSAQPLRDKTKVVRFVEGESER